MAGWLWFWFWLCISSGLANGKLKERNFRFVIEKFQFKSASKLLFEDFNYKVTKFRNRSYLNCNFMIQRNVDQLDIDMQLDMLRPNSQILRLYKIRMDACQFLTTVHKNPLINILASRFMNVSNVNLTCPLINHFNYSISDCHLVEADFPSYIPECQLKGLTKFYTKNKLSLIMAFLGSVIHNNTITIRYKIGIWMNRTFHAMYPKFFSDIHNECSDFVCFDDDSAIKLYTDHTGCKG
ncbi:uncharacterized protein LOC117781297 [Drosophila innubila]|uniref:uncharacterized protein LOC117781297 n=1 Tax=Drosophila innubila TaxID=198719 RepID=UPI00148D398A|nr:uncharacterized protein LOC117781297 [Drosophila innubila]